MTTTRNYLIVLLLASIALAAVVGWLRYTEPVPPANVQVPATPAQEVKKVTKVVVPLTAKTVKAYPASVKKRLSLPEAVQLDTSQAVIASSQVQADLHQQTVTSVLNTDTGEVETFTRRDPLPWIATDAHGEAGIALVLKNGEPVVRADARQGLIQVKAAHLGVVGAVAQKVNGDRATDWEVGVRVWVPW